MFIDPNYKMRKEKKKIYYTWLDEIIKAMKPHDKAWRSNISSEVFSRASIRQPMHLWKQFLIYGYFLAYPQWAGHNVVWEIQGSKWAH